MPLFSVMRRGQSPVTVQADNWIVAMGEGIPMLDGNVTIERLACEMLQNGTVVARDVLTGIGYIILPMTDSTKEPNVEALHEAVECVVEVPIELDADEENFDLALKQLKESSQATDAWELAIELLCAEARRRTRWRRSSRRTRF